MNFLSVVAFAAALAAGVQAGGPTVASGNIKNVVLLVMENRSFDHLLGWWARTRQDVDGVPENASNVCSATGQVLTAEPNAQYIQELDPNHGLFSTTQQIFGSANVSTMDPGNAVPTMGGFCDAATTTWNTTDPALLHGVIDGFAPSKIPITTALANEFAVFDRWYAGVPGPTFPNRLFLYSATSNGLFFNDAKQLLAGFPQKSIFKHLEENKITWKNYFGQIPTSLIFKDVRNVGDVLGKLRPTSEFYADAAKGTLPSFSYIDPILLSLPGVSADDMHPPHAIPRGEALFKKIYEALRNGPQWNQTAFVITFDEHGGFYDHVAPPEQGIPSPDAASDASTTFHFNRLGVRVPTIVISPWIKKGRVVHRPEHGPLPTSEFEHSSISATLNNMFKLGPLTRRDAWAGTFDYLFNELSAPRDTPRFLPDVPELTEQEEKLDVENEWAEIMTVFNALKAGKAP
ncbi:hypothetical protein HDU76_004779 [Blyttiomyces sp. JEL0837]|nr:hypothetical protein HDU76_004779 [Blyttiomyces sp. JEL0837]